MAERIDGKMLAEAIKAELATEVEALKGRGITPGLAAVLVGEDPASRVYVRSKRRACLKLGMRSEIHELAKDVREEAVLARIAALNEDAAIHGILVQQPLPPQVRLEAVVRAVTPAKDVDCFHPENVGLVLAGTPRFLPATPAGVRELLVRSGHPPDGRHVVILGRSNIVGKPLAALLMQKAKGANATVTVCHTGTRDMAAHTRRADILVAAIGRPAFVTADMVREGVVVVDVGINRVADPEAPKGYRLVGDVAYDEVAAKAEAITPVPGGVGPMTIAMLLRNTVAAAKAQVGEKG
jgi:methylenetetrahydrofolate dehydrogenase (NADP+)/methenyltetrahydrofolate cyclohydrolase